MTISQSWPGRLVGARLFSIPGWLMKWLRMILHVIGRCDWFYHDSSTRQCTICGRSQRIGWLAKSTKDGSITYIRWHDCPGN